MENQSNKTKRNRRKKKQRRNRSRCTRLSGGNTSSQRQASLGLTNSFAVPPQSNWFWETYRHVMDWQGRHQVAYWKSRAQAVECQNAILMDYVERMNTDVDFDSEKSRTDTPIHDTDDEDEHDIEEETNGESLVFEVSEEMHAFFQQSIKHKQEIKKLKDAERSRLAHMHDNVGAVTLNAKNEMEESTLLYGKNAPAIMAMETAMQLTFERFVERAKPRLWPNLPLNL